MAALATPPGESALALIRCSGPGSVALLSAVFSRPAKLCAAPGNTLVHGWIRNPPPLQGLIDEVLVAVYRAPKSYTGEEGADISCHGGAAAAKAVMAALRAAGFRESLPGEFSFRAFMNGKLDLTRSESVMELVRAKTERGREHAAARLAGRLGEEIAALKGALVEALAEAELHLDYDEGEFEAPGTEGPSASWPGASSPGANLPGRPRVEAALERLRALAGTWGRERLYQEGALAVIAGRPNAGKSSLFNALLGEDRSIVTDIPGTTRDWIEALVAIEGIPLRLADTAGLREDSGSGDRIERLGIERSLELLDRADLVLYVIDGAQGLQAADEAFLRAGGAQGGAGGEARGGAGGAQGGAGRPFILVWNKADLAPPPGPESFPAPFPRPLPVSAKTGAGLAELCRAMAGALEGPHPLSEGPGGPGLGSGRQKELVDRSCAALEEALALADRGEELELIAPCLREAVNALGEITGEVSTADILETIFSKFCVGK
jgi:tRNA modification GTPase